MLTDDAIDRLQELILSASNEPCLNGLATPTAIIPNNARLVSLERFQDAPRRRRATVEFTELAAFVEYVKAEATEQAAIFFHAASATVTAFFDYSNAATAYAAGWCDHRAILTLQRTPELEAALELCQSRRTQQEVIDWLEDWGQVIQPISARGDPLTPSAAITQLRRLEVNATKTKIVEVGDFQSSRSALDSVEAAVGDQQPPASFVLSAPFYRGTGAVELPLRLSVVFKDNAAAIKLRPIGFEALRQVVLNELRDALRTELKQIDMYFGALTVHLPGDEP